MNPTCKAEQDLEAAYVEYRPTLERRIHAILGQTEATEDVLQEAFLRAWRSGPATSDPRALYAWLARTATNLAFDEVRRRRRRPESSLDRARRASARESDQALTRDVLARLSAHDRFVVLMRFEAGFSAAELGEMLGVAEETARKRVERARRRFRNHFAGVADSSPLAALPA